MKVLVILSACVVISLASTQQNIPGVALGIRPHLGHGTRLPPSIAATQRISPGPSRPISHSLSNTPQLNHGMGYTGPIVDRVSSSGQVADAIRNGAIIPSPGTAKGAAIAAAGHDLVEAHASGYAEGYDAGLAAAAAIAEANAFAAARNIANFPDNNSASPQIGIPPNFSTSRAIVDPALTVHAATGIRGAPGIIPASRVVAAPTIASTQDLIGIQNIAISHGNVGHGGIGILPGGATGIAVHPSEPVISSKVPEVILISAE